MTIQTPIQFCIARMNATGDHGYFALWRAIVWGLWIMLAKPHYFEHGGMTIQNPQANGSLRVFGGGSLMVLTGLLMIAAGAVMSVLTVAALLLSPLTALGVFVYASIKARAAARRALARIEELKKGRSHGGV